MKIEILYPELCNLYGDNFHQRYLSNFFDEVYVTSLKDTPKFVSEQVDFVYLGSCADKYLEAIILKLRVYKKEIEKYIRDDKIFLVTGNSLEIFGNTINILDKQIEGLKIFNFRTEKDFNKRYNQLFLGEYHGYKIVGHKSQFSLIFEEQEYPFIKKIKGLANNLTATNEGIKYKNFYGTYLLGPFLITNPYFLKDLLKTLGITKSLPFESIAIKSYEKRLEDFSNPLNNMISKH